jgi:transcriptional regulator with XRE-family HTH domain
MADTNGANLKEALAAEKEILRLETEIDKLAEKKGKRAKEQLATAQKDLATKKAVLDNSKAFAEYQKKINKDTDAFGKSWTKLSSAVQKNLGGTNRNATVYSSISTKIIALEAKQAGLTGDELEANLQMVSRLREQNDSMLQQAKTTATAEAKARGMNDIAIKRKELEEEITKAKEEGNEELREALELEKQALELRDKLEKQENRLTEIKSQQDDLINQLPDGLKSSIGFAKGLGNAIKAGMGPLFLIGGVLALAISSFKELDESAKKFRETTGLTNSQMEGIRSQANEIAGEFGNLGVNAEKVFDTVAALKSEFSDTAEFSKETTAALTVLSANFGVSAQAAAKVQSQFEAIGGLSSETAANVQMQVAQQAKLAGVAPTKVFEDIAENAEAASTFFKGDLNALTKNAIQARRLGSSLKEQVDLAEKLLDFESGIEEELVAATFVGGQFNLSQARGLAMAGKTAEAQEEVLRQIQRSGDFRKQDLFTQKQLAKASGMSVEEINKQLNAQDKLNSLSAEQRKAAEDAIEKGLDITNINADQLAQETEKFAKQQEQQAQLEKLNNAFMGMASTIGSVLIPLIDAISIALTPVQLAVELIQFVFGGIGESISKMIGPLGTVGKVLKGLAGLAVIYAAYSVFGWMTAATMGFGVIAAGIASAAILVAGFATLSKIGDMNSPADGKTQVSTKEGGLFELSPNDDLVAAPGAAAALSNANAGGGGGGASAVAATPQLNLSALSAPLNAMINEIKALRADMASGKIAVYMDTAKVTANISTNVDQGTRNSFNLGSA